MARPERGGGGVSERVLVVDGGRGAGQAVSQAAVDVAVDTRDTELLDAGVSVCTFQPSMLHAKIMTVDGLVANVGSANVNHRSTQYDEEINLVVFDPDVVRILDEHFDEDLGRSTRIDPTEWRDRGPAQRVVEKAAGEFGRFRDVVPGPDGEVWAITNNTDGRGSPRDGDDRLLRIPMEESG